MSKNQAREIKRMQKKAKDRDDLDFCKENRSNIDYIKKEKDLLTFCREHRDKIDELMYLTQLIDGMPLQQRPRAQSVERDLNQIRLQLLQGKVKAIWVEPLDNIVPPKKKSSPIPIPGAKIEELEEGYETDTEEEDEKKEKPITIEKID